MAKNYQVSATELTPGATIMVRGKTTFSRLAKLVEGAELARSDASRVQNGMQAINRPHTSINLAQSSVVFANPAEPTKEEIFVHERHFLSTKNPENGQSYSLDNKSNTLPIVGTRNANGQVEQVVLTGDLAAGLDVTLVMRVYKPKGYPNCGLSLDYVIVEEELRYYSGGANSAELADRGIIFAAPPVRVSGAAAAAANPVGMAVAGNGFPANTDPNSGLPTPGAPVVPAVAATPPVMQPAPVAQVQAVPAAAPGLTAEQQIAQLQAQVAAQNAALAGSGGADSAFGAAPADPWVTPVVPAPVPQGISYSA